jgi:hypothetical protein
MFDLLPAAGFCHELSELAGWPWAIAEGLPEASHPPSLAADLRARTPGGLADAPNLLS